jgi:hypothetical protein
MRRLATNTSKAMTASLHLVTRRPKRITITVSYAVAEHLFTMSDEQGRSTSNLAAHLLEVALEAMHGEPPIKKKWPGKG